MTKIGIILGSTRPGRNGEAVARWVLDVAAKRGDADYELVVFRGIGHWVPEEAPDALADAVLRRIGV